ncbi:hypothetical protein E4U39_003741 [Claviceps sp. Clav50 group G5]|nr:hypothetical protein E4U39_003741 [Claviceps sp. Clav50 group G5]
MVSQQSAKGGAEAKDDGLKRHREEHGKPLQCGIKAVQNPYERRRYDGDMQHIARCQKERSS